MYTKAHTYIFGGIWRGPADADGSHRVLKIGEAIMGITILAKNRLVDLYYITLYYTTLYYITLYYIAILLYYIILYYIILYFVILYMAKLVKR